MRIIIDARLWSESGLGRYIRNLVDELQKLDRNNEYLILHLEKDTEKINFKNSNFKKVLADFKWYGVDEQIKLPKLLNQLKPDLVHFPHFNVPIFYQGKFIVTIHDLIHQHFSTRQTTTLNPLLHSIKKLGYKKTFSSAIKNSVKIIVPSEFVRGQLTREWGVSEEKIIVTYEGVDEGVVREIRVSGDEDSKRLMKKFGVNKPYLFYVGNAQPHKNIPALIKGFSEARKKYSDLNIVLSGPESFFWKKIQEELGGLEKLEASGIIFTGFITESEMVAFYKNAEAFVMPSLEEGFGIPLLEAMASGCPVVSSNAASLPEVGRDAVLYFDPKNIDDLTEKINKVLSNEKLRKDLIKRGEKRYKQFSWGRMAKQTLEVYQGSF